MNRKIENNQVTISGEVVSEFLYSHELYGEKFYFVDVKTQRLSYAVDVLPVIVSDRLVDISQNCEGLLVEITGQFRSFNRHAENKCKLVLTVFAREFNFIDTLEDSPKSNQIYLEGYICKEPVYRKTPMGREITDLLLAVNRPYGKTDYIPCICWGRNARYANSLNVGEYCIVAGRIQSREYIKKLDEERTEQRIAYEVSVSRLEVPQDEE